MRAGIYLLTVNGEDEAEPHAHTHHGHAHHEHRNLSDMFELIDGLTLPDAVKSDVKEVYSLLAGAEGEVHGREAGEVHFHEVGALDAVADIGVCLLMRELGPERVVVSPVRVGYGSVKCAHGVLPVPAPATAVLLRGLPVYAGDIEGEMCTPTGAALLKHFATETGRMPEMRLESYGHRHGQPEVCCCELPARLPGRERAAGRRCKRAALQPGRRDCRGPGLCAAELLLERGALDVYTQAIGMKKGRAGVMLTCLCAAGQAGGICTADTPPYPEPGPARVLAGANNAAPQRGDAGDRLRPRAYKARGR